MVGLLARSRFFTEQPAGSASARGLAAARRRHADRTLPRPTDVPSQVRSDPPLPRRDERRLRRPLPALVPHLGVGASSSASSRSCIRGLNLGIDFEGGVVWEVPAGDVSVDRRPGPMEGAGPRGRHRADARRPTATCASASRPSPSTSQGRRRSAQRWPSSTGSDRRRGEPQLGRPVVGRRDQREGAAGTDLLPDRHHDLHHAPLRAAHGHPHARRPGPRHAHHGRRVLAWSGSR